MSLLGRELMDNREICIFPIEALGGEPEDGLVCLRLAVLAFFVRCEKVVVTSFSADATVL